MSAARQFEFQVITRDSQSTGNRAADVTGDLILREKVDLLIAGGAPDTTNAVASQAEINEVPCINTACPWQPWFFGRKGDPKKGFNWTYLFCFGVEDIHAAFLDLWSGSQTNKVVGGLFANDADGNAWAQGLPPALQKAGFKVVDPGRYQPMTDDFTSFIAAFKAAGAEIVTGTMTPPDFGTFWNQAAQQGFRPKIATIGKAFLFPSAVAALGDRAEGLSCEVPWSPVFPFKSGLTGQSGSELADDYTRQTGRPAAFTVGMFHALFEVAIDCASAQQIDRRSARDPRCDTADQLQFDPGSCELDVGPQPGEECFEDPDCRRAMGPSGPKPADADDHQSQCRMAGHSDGRQAQADFIGWTGAGSIVAATSRRSFAH